MKRWKIFVASLGVSALFACGGILAACGEDNKTENPDGGEPSHTHEWTWESNANEHWQICEEDSEEKPGSRGAHIDENENGECDVCKRPLPSTGGEQTDDLFSADYIGTWQFKAGGEVMATLEIEANTAKFAGKAITVTKNADGSEIVYSFSETIGEITFDFSFSLTSDGYAILLTQSVDVGGEINVNTYTMLPADFDPAFVAAPDGYEGMWTDGANNLLVGAGDEAGELYFNGDPITILTVAAGNASATALVPHDGSQYWAQITFGEGEIVIAIEGGDTYTFAPAEEAVEFPRSMWGDWIENGVAEDAARIITIEKESILFDGEDVTATAGVEYQTITFATVAGTVYELNITSDEYVIYMNEQGKTEYTLFVKDEALSLKLGAASNLKGKTFAPASGNTLGDLAVAADGTLTLGGKATQVLSMDAEAEETSGWGTPTITVTAFTFLCDNMWYRAVIDSGITLTSLTNQTYKYNGARMTDFTGYVGTWKAFFTATAQPNNVTITITETQFQYNGVAKDCYIGADGSTYYWDIRAIPFGFLDEEKTILRVELGAGWFFNQSGEIPEVTDIPEAFRGNWNSDNFYGLLIGASSIAVDGKQYTPFAITGEEGEEVIHAISDKYLYVTFKMGTDAAGEAAVIMGDGSMTQATFEAVKPEPLPQEYQGTWTELGGTDTVTVSAEGAFTYKGRVYPTTVDNHTGSYHFTLEGGAVGTVEVSSDEYVLWIIDGDNVTYYTKVALTELPDVALTAFKDTAWTNAEAGATITFDAQGKATVMGKKVQILTQEADLADTIGTLIYDNAWYDFRISGNTITITTAMGSVAFTKQGAQAAFVAPPAMIGTWNQIGESGMTVVIASDSVTVAGEALTGLSVAQNKIITGQQAGSACTITLMDENVILVTIAGAGSIYFAMDGTSSEALTQIKSTNWTEATLGTFAVAADGKATLKGESVYISTIVMGGLSADKFVSFTIVVGGEWYEVEVGTGTLTFTDAEGNEYTFTQAA